ncbi:MAG: transglycosylase SLT domain-containing protein [Alphaproteobacteria bacterium]|jgi:hypothetical protein|nr:transglycosylase SLT domain-containing protein [Alphaproteobacteria bacterium]MBT5390568.1 transglycosylase SLT domain-containing protein [Alphaproteobacteria bacterium]MBT5540927.1 transglycosylase SLT domain-containing protein [Alphaproteobacteria bacterium]MBT5654343.1 transglycosylase SLT domain-containing protein [Alphaproteobacteria bacterium]
MYGRLSLALKWVSLIVYATLIQLHTAQSAPKVAALCHTPIAKWESQSGIPAQLLLSIGIAESGKYTKGKVVVWPWTIGTKKAGYYLSSKDEAIKKVKALQAQGVKSIDVGCMQINLKYHPTAFQNLDEAFDPKSNVAYAASFLTDLHTDLKSWKMAVAHYHSSIRKHHEKYRNRVYDIWSTRRQSKENKIFDRSFFKQAVFRGNRVDQVRATNTHAQTLVMYTSNISTHPLRNVVVRPISEVPPKPKLQKANFKKKTLPPLHAKTLFGETKTGYKAAYFYLGAR